MFQFHFGSIGRIELLNDNSKSKKVSIPLWFDWKSYWINEIFCHFTCFNSTLVRLEGGFRFYFQKFKTVSIPLWFDWKCFENNTSCTSLLVSIPLWFDWKSIAPDSLRWLSLFQFHFGSIGRKCWFNWEINWWIVSIPLWFDWKSFCSSLYVKHVHVSIPLWFDWKR